MTVRLKGATVTAFTLCLGSLLLFVRSGTATALGVALIVLASAAVVTWVSHDRRETDARSRRTN
jgi:hypothetical protein